MLTPAKAGHCFALHDLVCFVCLFSRKLGRMITVTYWTLTWYQVLYERLHIYHCLSEKFPEQSCGAVTIVTFMAG